MKTVRIVLFLLLIVSSVSAVCPNATRSMLVPAVVGEEGWRMLLLHVETREGVGNVYSSIEPRIGVSTQSSEDTAAYVAFGRAGVNRGECDVLFRVIDRQGSTFVDGPSAGAAMTIMLIAALENRTIRDDMAVTGTIETDGSVGPVGGLIEKASAVTEKGMDVFVTPTQSAYERMLLSTMNSNMSIVGVDEIGKLEEIAFSKSGSPVETESEIPFKPLPEGLKENPLHDEENLLFFKQMSEGIIGQLEEPVNGMDAGNEGLIAYKEYFEKEVGKQKELVSKGYLYTAANNAFLLSIDASLIGMRSINDSDIEEEKNAVGKCIEGLPKINKTDGNFEWIIGSDLRKEWAEKKLGESGKYGSLEEKYAGMRELLFAKGWCDISGMLSREGSGEGINESVLKDIAEERINEAEEFMNGSGEPLADEEWHLEAAEKAFTDGNYGASIYDATYALSMGEAEINFATRENTSITEECGNLSKKNMTSFWANLYQGQGRFLYYSGDSLEGGYKILRFADALDEVTKRMRDGIGKEEAGAVKETEGKTAGETGKEDGKAPVVIGVLFRCIILASLFLLAKRR